MHNSKKLIAFYSILLLAVLQAYNIIVAVQKLQSIQPLTPRLIKEMLSDTFVCRAEVCDITLIYYIYRNVRLYNIINFILIIGIVIALVIYFKETKNIGAIIPLCLNVGLFMITAFPNLVLRLSRAYVVINLFAYDFAFFTADYKTVPAVIAVYAVLIAGYLFFFASCLYRYLKKRKAAPAI